MDIMELGAIGELVGGVAVIASLLYVGLQLRQSNKVAKSESIREIARETSQLYLKTCDPELSFVLRRAIHDFDALSGNDQSIAAGFFGAWVLSAQTTFAVRSSPRASQVEHLCASLVGAAGLGSWWNASRKSYSPEFVQEMERLAKAGVVPWNQVWPWFVLDESETREV